MPTKNLLLIRPKHDGYTEQTYKAADLLLNEAKALGWNIRELKDGDSNRSEVESALSSTAPAIDFVIHYGHGNKDVMYGQKGTTNPQLQGVVDKKNVEKLGGKAVSTVSCYTTQDLGVAAIGRGARGYLGYKNPIGFPKSTTFQKKFQEGFNAANIALLQESTFKDAFTKGWNTFDQKWREIHDTTVTPEEEYDKWLAEAIMIHNRDSLELRINPKIPNGRADL